MTLVIIFLENWLCYNGTTLYSQETGHELSTNGELWHIACELKILLFCTVISAVLYAITYYIGLCRNGSQMCLTLWTFQYKDYLSRYKDFYHKDKVVMQLSYLYKGGSILLRWQLYIEMALKLMNSFFVNYKTVCIFHLSLQYLTHISQ